MDKEEIMYLYFQHLYSHGEQKEPDKQAYIVQGGEFFH